jgi:hypothetical protein
VRKAKGKWLLGRPRRSWEDIRMDLSWVGVGWLGGKVISFDQALFTMYVHRLLSKLWKWRVFTGCVHQMHRRRQSAVIRRRVSDVTPVMLLVDAPPPFPVNVKHTEISRRRPTPSIDPRGDISNLMRSAIFAGQSRITYFYLWFQSYGTPVQSYETRFILQWEVVGRSFRG